jgi:hypothetical protein
MGRLVLVYKIPFYDLKLIFLMFPPSFMQINLYISAAHDFACVDVYGNSNLNFDEEHEILTRGRCFDKI